MNMQMALTDYSFAIMDSKKRPLDFVLIGKLKKPITEDLLKGGAQKAFKTFPKSNCCIKGKKFVPCENEWQISFKNSQGRNQKNLIEEFISTPFNLEKERGIKQLVIDQSIVVTRFHHAVADGLSLCMWLKVQLLGTELKDSPLELQAHPSPIKKSIYAASSKSNVIGKITGNISSNRKYKSVSFKKPADNLKEKGISYNDLLCAIVLETIKGFNTFKGINVVNNCLYIPMNIRKNPFSGFGNGSSRIKIHDTNSNQLSILEKSKYIREQVKWSRVNGSWSVPTELGVLKLLPKSVGRMLLNTASKLPSSEFGSIIFSHVERYTGIEDLFDLFSDLETVSQLYKKYPMCLSATTLKDKTILTCTWDNALITESEISEFFNILSTKQKLAFRELNLS